MKIENELKLARSIKPAKKTIIHLMFIGDYVLNEINTALKPYQLSNQQYNVMRILRGQKGKPMSLADLQSRMIHKNSNTTRLIDKLIIKKFVTRKPDEDNRRRVKINISEEGLELLKELDPKIEAVEHELMKHLTDQEHELLNAYLEKLRA